MAQARAQAHAHDDHGSAHYIKIWGILLVLLLISVLGPMFEVGWLTLATAFGIAVVKAYLVAKNFMHITVEKRYIMYMMATCLVFMLLFFAGVAPDVMKDEGSGWVKPNNTVNIPLEAEGHSGGGHSGGSGEH